ncbi:MAG: hypothetical protein M3R04_01375 [bacterium]|nr:hypothetical protein [bacterium]
MFEITVKGDSVQELILNLQCMATYSQGVPTAKPPTRKAKAVAPVPEPELVAADEVDRELLEEVPPQPNAASAVVDAGTGQIIAQPESPVQMTMDQVRTNAAKLAAKDSPTLAMILKKYGAGKLSEVNGEQLGDFASDVMEALG